MVYIRTEDGLYNRRWFIQHKIVNIRLIRYIKTEVGLYKNNFFIKTEEKLIKAI